MLTLDEIGIKHQTDKASAPVLRDNISWGAETSYPIHNYLVKYALFLDSLRDKEFTLVEIGIGRGGSMRMWKEYFPKANIVGIDIRPECKGYEEDRIEIHIINGEDGECANYLKSRYDRPLIIVEDGSHTFDGQRTALESLFPFLDDGGYYIVEDLSNGMANYLRVRTEALTLYRNELRQKTTLLNTRTPEERYIDLQCDVIAFVSAFACVLKKSEKSTVPTIISGEDAKQLSVQSTECLEAAIAKLYLSRSSAIAVLDGDKFIGILSDGDIHRFTISDALRPVGECCNRNCTVSHSFDMVGGKRLYAPVVDDNNVFLGFRYEV